MDTYIEVVAIQETIQSDKSDLVIDEQLRWLYENPETSQPVSWRQHGIIQDTNGVNLQREKNCSAFLNHLKKIWAVQTRRAFHLRLKEITDNH